MTFYKKLILLTILISFTNAHDLTARRYETRNTGREISSRTVIKRHPHIPERLRQTTQRPNLKARPKSIHVKSPTVLEPSIIQKTRVQQGNLARPVLTQEQVRKNAIVKNRLDAARIIIYELTPFSQPNNCRFNSGALIVSREERIGVRMPPATHADYVSFQKTTGKGLRTFLLNKFGYESPYYSSPSKESLLP